MKGSVGLSVVVCFAMICSCHKHDPAAEAQLAQREAELDTREKALDEREKAMGAWEKAITRWRADPSYLRSHKPAVDPEQAKAEREQRIQQLPPELRALIRDRSLLDPRTEKPIATQDRAAELQRRLEEARRKKMSAMTSPNEAADTQSNSPAPSPTPE